MNFKLPKTFNKENTIVLLIASILFYMIYDVIVNSKEYYCNCGAHKQEGFCGNLFSEKCKPECPQGVTSYGFLGIETRNKRMLN